MQRDEPTLPESLHESLLRAGFATDEASELLIEENLRAHDARTRVLALRAGLRRDVLDDEDWLFAIADDSPEVRREALTLIAYVEIDDESIMRSIVGALDDADPLVVDAATFALGEHLYVDAADRLSEIARHHEDARCRESAVAALGAFGDDRGRAAVLGALDDKPAVRRRAIVALSNFEGPDIDAALERAGEDRDWQVRAAVSQLTRDDETN